MDTNHALFDYFGSDDDNGAIIFGRIAFSGVSSCTTRHPWECLVKFVDDRGDEECIAPIKRFAVRAVIQLLPLLDHRRFAEVSLIGLAAMDLGGSHRFAVVTRSVYPNGDPRRSVDDRWYWRLLLPLARALG